MEPLKDFPVTHTGIKPVEHAELKLRVPGRTAVKYLRFLKPVELDRLELPPHVYGRWVPQVPIHPAHIVVSVLDRTANRWTTIDDVQFDPRPAIRGDALKQDMAPEEMEAHFRRVMETEPPYVIPLRGLRTDHLRVECDREHPVWPSHGECNGGIYNVPYGLLNPLKAIGRAADDKPIPDRQYEPRLKQSRIRPVAPSGMTLKQLPHLVMYRSDRLCVGFSLVRPTLLHLGFDMEGSGFADVNRLLTYRHCVQRETFGGLTGPLLRTLDADNPYWLWSGEVSVEGDRVSYRKLQCGHGVAVDVVFTVRQDGLTLELIVNAEAPVPALEWEAWRFLWSMKSAMTSTAAMPTLREGRNGDVELPAYIVGSGVGCLACRVLEGNVNLQTESYRYHQWFPCRADGFSVAPFPAPGTPIVIPRGTQRAVLDFALTNILPESPKAEAELPVAIRRAWSSVFTSFRPETGGFSNNAVSVNCHCNQAVCADLATFSRRAPAGPDPLALARFTVERGLLDGPGYAYHRELYLDADPVLVCAAGRLYRQTGDVAWLRRVAPGLAAAAERMLGNVDRETGLIVCRNLTGNSGSNRWSSNALDCVGFGHMDAYVNAWCYRALRNAEALFAALGDAVRAGRCADTAAALREAYPRWLVNPDTGWVVGWRSRDGQLHDYAFTITNGPACAFGLLDEAQARRALAGLERLRREAGPPSAYFGVPMNFLPMPKDDYVLGLSYAPMDVSFEDFINGSQHSCHPTAYYIRALARAGMRAEASAICRELAQGYADRVFNGRYGEGAEFHSWEGCNAGYEGTFGPAFGSLYAIAIEFGVFKPPEPEWWPERDHEPAAVLNSEQN
ncbi:MAG: hypothetical protein PHR35_17290 [Kiritimatiellae bacterium]|nr:hypothetical protein [Kiritimatiellia bacterium]